MPILRSFSRQLSSNGFRLSMLLLAIVGTILATVGTAQTVKDTLKGSGVYTTLTETIVKQVTNGSQDDKGNADGNSAATNDTLQQPEVQDAAKAAFNPAFLQSSSEQVIDGTYHWLDGKAPNPDFKVDLTPAVNTFEGKAAEAATSRVKKLPACTLQQLREIDPATIDPFQLSCLPPGFNVDAHRQAFIDSLTDKNEFLQNPILTADRIPKDDKGQTVFERASVAPKVFHWLTIAPWILGTLALLLGTAVVFLSFSRRRGVGNLAVSLIGIGLLLFVIGVLSGFVFRHFFNSTSSPLHLTDGSTQQSVVGIIGAFNHVISRSLFMFGGIYVGVGVITLATLRLTRPNEPTSGPLDDRRAAIRNDTPGRTATDGTARDTTPDTARDGVQNKVQATDYDAVPDKTVRKIQL
jgi:hypothetical protein